MGVADLLLLTKKKSQEPESTLRQYRVRVTDEGHDIRITNYNWKTGQKESKDVHVTQEDSDIGNVLKRARK